MISAEDVAQIRHLFYAEHWKIGTIATELRLHPETVRAALETDRFHRPPRLRDRLADPYLEFLRQTLQQYPRLRVTRVERQVFMCNGNTEPKPASVPISDDYVELLKKQRELALPSNRIASYDDFAKWLFTTATVVGTLGAAFSNAAFKNLQGSASVLFFAAVAATGVSLALAVIERTIEPKDANFQDLNDMLQKAKAL